MAFRRIGKRLLVLALAVVLIAGSNRAYAQGPTNPPNEGGHVWGSLAGGISSRSYVTTPVDGSGAVSVGVRWPIGESAVSLRVGAMAQTSLVPEGQYSTLASMMFSLPSKRLHRPGLNPYALLGVGLYGQTPIRGSGGAHAGFGLQVGGQRYSSMVEWTRHAVFNVSQLTLGVSRRMR
jgi:hypothetical protein